MQGKRLGLLLALLLMTSSVFAGQMSMPYGWYIEANAGSSHLSEKSYPGSASSSGIGGNGNIGYKFMPYFAIEAGYSMYPNTDIDSNGTQAATDKHYSYDLAAKGILPITDSGFELLAKLGAARVSSHVTIDNQDAANQIGIGSGSHSSTGIYIGAGGQYYFLPELAVVVQWQRATGNSSTGTFDLVGGGLNFIFG